MYHLGNKKKGCSVWPARPHSQHELVRLLQEQVSQPNKELRTTECRSLLPTKESRERHQGIASSPAPLQLSLTSAFRRQVVTLPEGFSLGRKEWMDLQEHTSLLSFSVQGVHGTGLMQKVVSWSLRVRCFVHMSVHRSKTQCV